MSEHLPTTGAAERAGLTPASFRRAMMRLRESGGPDLRRPGPDARTPLWDAAALDAWLASRPGRWPDRAPRLAAPATGPSAGAGDDR